jgi:hypothetical protein
LSPINRRIIHGGGQRFGRRLLWQRLPCCFSLGAPTDSSGSTSQPSWRRSRKSNRFAEQIRQRLCGFTAQDLKKHDLLRVATATDAAEIVAEIDSVLRDREASVPEESKEVPSVENILAHMSAYMEVPLAA